MKMRRLIKAYLLEKPLLLIVLLIALYSKGYSQLSFTITNLSGNDSITCNKPLIILQANSTYTLAPVNYTWNHTQLGSVLGHTISTPWPGNYTVTANSGSLNAIEFYTLGSYTAVPQVTVFLSSDKLTCYSPTVLLTGQTNIATANFKWKGPFSVYSSTYIASVAGSYTLLVLDSANGCFNEKTQEIFDTRLYPQFKQLETHTLACPNGTVKLSPEIQGSTTGVNFKWTIPIGAFTSSVDSLVLITDHPGNYTLTATNNLNGCTSNTLMSVWACVGINEEKTNHNTFILVNQGGNLLQIKAHTIKEKRFTVKIFDTNGNLKYNALNTDLPDNIDIGHFSEGMYLMKLESEGKTTWFKFLKLKA